MNKNIYVQQVFHNEEQQSKFLNYDNKFKHLYIWDVYHIHVLDLPSGFGGRALVRSL